MVIKPQFLTERKFDSCNIKQLLINNGRLVEIISDCFQICSPVLLFYYPFQTPHGYQSNSVSAPWLHSVQLRGQYGEVGRFLKGLEERFHWLAAGWIKKRWFSLWFCFSGVRRPKEKSTKGKITEGVFFSFSFYLNSMLFYE